MYSNGIDDYDGLGDWWDVDNAETLTDEETCTKPHKDILATLPSPALINATSLLLQACSGIPRTTILYELSQGSCCVHELVEILDMPQPAVSQHLKVLRRAGVVVCTAKGRERHYSLSDPSMAEILRLAMKRAQNILEEMNS